MNLTAAIAAAIAPAPVAADASVAAQPGRTVTVSYALPDKLLADILTTAVEGGIGYWAGMRRAKRDADLSILSLQIRDEGDDGSPASKYVDVTLDTIAAGVQRVLASPSPCRSDIADAVRRAAADPDEADIDAEAADVILQLGLLGEVRYG